jgi:hypothetical protein
MDIQKTNNDLKNIKNEKGVDNINDTNIDNSSQRDSNKSTTTTTSRDYQQQRILQPELTGNFYSLYKSLN